MNITSVQASGIQRPLANNPRNGTVASFTDMLKSNIAAASGSAPADKSLDGWLRNKISGGKNALPATVDAAGKKADELAEYLGGILGAAFKSAGISGTNGISAVFENGEFYATGRMICLGPSRPINGIGMSEIIDCRGESEVFDSGLERWNTNHIMDFMSKKINECLKNAFDESDSAILGEFSLNKAIHELSKFDPTFRQAYDNNPAAATEAYKEEIAAYMPGVMFPVNGDR